jgi:hypothetical protein
VARSEACFGPAGAKPQCAAHASIIERRCAGGRRRPPLRRHGNFRHGRYAKGSAEARRLLAALRRLIGEP